MEPLITIRDIINSFRVLTGFGIDSVINAFNIFLTFNYWCLPILLLLGGIVRVYMFLNYFFDICMDVYSRNSPLRSSNDELPVVFLDIRDIADEALFLPIRVALGTLRFVIILVSQIDILYLYLLLTDQLATEPLDDGIVDMDESAQQKPPPQENFGSPPTPPVTVHEIGGPRTVRPELEARRSIFSEWEQPPTVSQFEAMPPSPHINKNFLPRIFSRPKMKLTSLLELLSPHPPPIPPQSSTPIDSLEPAKVVHFESTPPRPARRSYPPPFHTPGTPITPTPNPNPDQTPIFSPNPETPGPGRPVPATVLLHNMKKANPRWMDRTWQPVPRGVVPTPRSTPLATRPRTPQPTRIQEPAAPGRAPHYNARGVVHETTTNTCMPCSAGKPTTFDPAVRWGTPDSLEGVRIDYGVGRNDHYGYPRKRF